MQSSVLFECNKNDLGCSEDVFNQIVMDNMKHEKTIATYNILDISRKEM